MFPRRKSLILKRSTDIKLHINIKYFGKYSNHQRDSAQDKNNHSSKTTGRPVLPAIQKPANSILLPVSVFSLAVASRINSWPCFAGSVCLAANSDKTARAAAVGSKTVNFFAQSHNPVEIEKNCKLQLCPDALRTISQPAERWPARKLYKQSTWVLRKVRKGFLLDYMYTRQGLKVSHHHRGKQTMLFVLRRQDHTKCTGDKQ